MHLARRTKVLTYTGITVVLIVIVFQITSLLTPTIHDNPDNSTNPTAKPTIITPSPAGSPIPLPTHAPTPNHTTPKPTEPPPIEPFINVTKIDSSVIVTNVNWGAIFLGETSEQKITIKNLLSTPVTISIEHSPMIPDGAAQYLSFFWSMNSSLNQIEAFGQAEVTLYLSASPNTQNVTEFSFQIIIRATAS